MRSKIQKKKEDIEKRQDKIEGERKDETGKKRNYHYGNYAYS